MEAILSEVPTVKNSILFANMELIDSIIKQHINFIEMLQETSLGLVGAFHDIKKEIENNSEEEE